MTEGQIFEGKILELVNEIEDQIMGQHQKIHDIVLYNQFKVLESYRKHHVSEQHLQGSTGYGYNDNGRDTLDDIYADVFGSEAALVRPQFISGTHTISTALFGVLRPGDDLLYVTGEPYDTLKEVIGIAGNGIGSFKEYNIGYDYVPLLEDGKVDIETVNKKITPKTKMIAIQRSRGYSTNPSFRVEEIGRIIEAIKKEHSHVIAFVDNCYGEFVEKQEPTHVGADLMAGSLIKNPGGGFAETGGYLAGREDLIEACGYRLTSPGVGSEAGATQNNLKDMYQGFFLAPHVVGEAMKGGVFTAAMVEKLGVDTNPSWDEDRTDLIQQISLHDEEKMVTFVQNIQKYSPIDAYVTPIGGYMPGYEDDVIMAAGTFVQGASIELSADGPIRAPYTVYLQGGLTYEHVKLAVSFAIKDMWNF